MKKRAKNVIGRRIEQLEDKRLLAADTIMGDANSDGQVDMQDFTMLAAHFGRHDATWAHGDFSGNRVVGFEDFTMLAGNFGFDGRATGERPEGQRPDGVGRPNRFGGRPDNVQAGANREPRVQAQIDRLQEAIDNGSLPEGVTAEQASERIAVLQNALATGERPEGQRPDGVGRPNRFGGRPDNVQAGANREARAQAQIDRLQEAIDNDSLPEGVTAEQASERIAVLQNALETGERPEGQRPDGVGRPNGFGGRPNSVEAGANREGRVQAQIDRLQEAIDNDSLPEGVTAEQASERIAVLQNALATGERPEGQRPERVGRPNRFGGRRPS